MSRFHALKRSYDFTRSQNDAESSSAVVASTTWRQTSTRKPLSPGIARSGCESSIDTRRVVPDLPQPTMNGKAELCGKVTRLRHRPARFCYLRRSLRAPCDRCWDFLRAKRV